MVVFTVVKVGRGSNKPTKFKVCAECGQECEYHRVDYKEPVKKSICFLCLVKAYEYKKKKESKWYNKIISFCIRSKPSPVVLNQKFVRVKTVPDSTGETIEHDYSQEEILDEAA
ncbi:MAG: hypothetical protein HQ552_05915 [Desulfobacteraceae bacterium]|nr:hypothetical protein [Desulfobacteraceae bacterium]